jgi:dihydrofolate reductase
MRRIRYSVATSLDGYIAGQNGETDWIIMDASIDFGRILNEFDTVVMGRRTFEVMTKSGHGLMPGMQTFVLTQTLKQGDYPDVKIVSDNAEKTMNELRAQSRKDIWLFGGGSKKARQRIAPLPTHSHWT